MRGHPLKMPLFWYKMGGLTRGVPLYAPTHKSSPISLSCCSSLGDFVGGGSVSFTVTGGVSGDVGEVVSMEPEPYQPPQPGNQRCKVPFWISSLGDSTRMTS